MNSEIAYILGIMGFTWLLLIFASAFLPYFTKKSIAFGIAVPRELYDNEFLSTVRQQYVWGNLVFGVLFMLIGLWMLLRLPDSQAAFTNVGLIFLYMIISFVFYIRAYHQVRDYKRMSDWTLSSIRSAQVTYKKDERALFSPWWYLSFLVITAALIALTLMMYPSLPDQIPQDVGMDGTVLSYAEKSISLILSVPMMMLAMTVLFAFLGWMINRAKRQTDDTDVARGLANNRAFQIIMGKMMFWLGFIMIMIIAGTQLSMLGLVSPQFTLWTSLALLVLVMAVMIYVMINIGQGGYRLSEREKVASGERVAQPRTRALEEYVVEDDDHWILWGTFYNNPDDPALFVEKRVGLGWTTNVGNPAGRRLMIVTGIGLVALLVAVPILMLQEM